MPKRTKKDSSPVLPTPDELTGTDSFTPPDTSNDAASDDQPKEDTRPLTRAELRVVRREANGDN